MATLIQLEEIRRAIGDEPRIEFNEILSDGANAAWRLTNAPVERGSESVFISGVIQQNVTSVSTLTSGAAVGDYQLNVADAGLFSVGDQVALDFEPNPSRYHVAEISGTRLVLAKRLTKAYDAGDTVYAATPVQYVFDYDAGIIYFAAVPMIGARLACKFSYVRYSDTKLDGLLTDAVNAVTLDLGVAPTMDTATQKALILLKLREAVLRQELRAGAGNAIKIRQGSTSLDMTGATSVARNEIDSVVDEYKRMLKQYMWNEQDESVGAAVVGREGYITT